MKINSLKLSTNRSLVAMALAVIAGLPVLGQSEQHSDGHRSAYFKNGEIHVNVLGEPEGKPLTTGHWDFKPSWSKTGNKLVFSGVSKIILRSVCGKRRSVSSMQTARVFIKSQMPRKPTSTRPGPGTAKTLPSGTERTQKAGDTMSWRGRSEENPGGNGPYQQGHAHLGLHLPDGWKNSGQPCSSQAGQGLLPHDSQAQGATGFREDQMQSGEGRVP